MSKKYSPRAHVRLSFSRDSFHRFGDAFNVSPAKAGVQYRLYFWIPAFAGMEDAESSAVLQAAFDRLSADQREIFIMRHYSGLSFKEIAGILGVPIGTVLARMSRAMARMRSELAE